MHILLRACCASALRLAPLTLARPPAPRVARAPRCLADAELLDGILATAEEAGRAAGAIMKEKLGADVIKTKAGAKDLLTAVDGECQRTIERIVKATFPTHSFLGEEDVAAGADAAGAALAAAAEDEWLWIVDPIDGTTNFAAGMPLSAVSIGVAHKGELVAGVIYDPYRDENFACRAPSASDRSPPVTTLNGEPVRVDSASDIGDAVVCAGSPPSARSMAPSLRGVVALSPKVRTIRMLGSAAIMMAWVSCGRLTAYFEPDLNAWDTAAGAVLVRGAGGRVTGLDGEEYGIATRTLLCSNGAAHGALLEALQEADCVGLEPLA